MLDGIRSFLRDGLRLTEALRLTGGSMKRKLSEASRLGNRILEAGPADQRSFLLDVVTRIEIGHDHVSIILRPRTLRAILSHGDADKQKAETEMQDKDEFALDLLVTFKRRGVEMKLVITNDQQKAPSPDPKLIAAIAHARSWFAELRDGKTRSISELAEQYRVDRGDVGKALRLAFLAPDIVQTILEGRHATGLTAARLRRLADLPVSWEDQRKLLGFGR